MVESLFFFTVYGCSVWMSFATTSSGLHSGGQSASLSSPSSPYSFTSVSPLTPLSTLSYAATASTIGSVPSLLPISTLPSLCDLYTASCLLFGSGFFSNLACMWASLSSSAFALFSTLAGSSFLHSQFLEYSFDAPTSLFSPVWAFFFSLTSLHGSHVVIGLAFLLFLSLSLILTPSSSPFPLFGLTYWHLVDSFWVFLLTALYFPLYSLISLNSLLLTHVLCSSTPVSLPPTPSST